MLIFYLKKGAEKKKTNHFDISEKKSVVRLLEEIERCPMVVLKLLSEDIVFRDILKDAGADKDEIRLTLEKCLILRACDNPQVIIYPQ